MYDLVFEYSQPDILPEGESCVIELTARVTRTEIHHEGEGRRRRRVPRAFAGQGTIGFYKSGELLFDGTTNPHGLVVHRFEEPLEDQPRSIQVYAGFNDPQMEVAISPHKWIKIPAKPKPQVEISVSATDFSDMDSPEFYLIVRCVNKDGTARPNHEGTIIVDSIGTYNFRTDEDGMHSQDVQIPTEMEMSKLKFRAFDKFGNKSQEVEMAMPKFKPPKPQIVAEAGENEDEQGRFFVRLKTFSSDREREPANRTVSVNATGSVTITPLDGTAIITDIRTGSIPGVESGIMELLITPAKSVTHIRFTLDNGQFAEITLTKTRREERTP